MGHCTFQLLIFTRNIKPLQDPFPNAYILKMEFLETLKYLTVGIVYLLTIMSLINGFKI